MHACKASMHQHPIRIHPSLTRQRHCPSVRSSRLRSSTAVAVHARLPTRRMEAAQARQTPPSSIRSHPIHRRPILHPLPRVLPSIHPPNPPRLVAPHEPALPLPPPVPVLPPSAPQGRLKAFRARRRTNTARPGGFKRECGREDLAGTAKVARSGFWSESARTFRCAAPPSLSCVPRHPRHSIRIDLPHRTTLVSHILRPSRNAGGGDL